MMKNQTKLVKYPYIKAYNKNKGFGLLEAMIACTLTMIIITIIYKAVINVKHNIVFYNELIYLQQNGNSAISIMTDSLINSAYTGCTNYAEYITITDNEYYNEVNYFNTGIFGISYNDKKLTSIDKKAKSDMILSYMLDIDNAKEIISYDGNFLYLHSRSIYKPNEFLTIITSDYTKIFSFVSGSKTKKNKVEVNFDDLLQTSECNPDNNTNCTENFINLQKLKKSGNKLYNQLGFAYYVRYSSNIPNLYRKKIGFSTMAEPLVEGIEQLAIFYNIKDEDKYVNLLTADQFNDAKQWNKVVAVYIELVVRSFTEILPEPQSYFFRGTWNEPNDKYKRKVYSTTITLQNKIL